MSENNRGRDAYSTRLVDKKSHLGHARNLFYRALRLRAPKVMRELDSRGPPLVKDDQTETFAFIEPERWPSIAPLGPFVGAWANRHHIDEPWVVIDAIDYVLALRNGDFSQDKSRHISAILDPGSTIQFPGSCIVWPVEFDFPAFVWHTGIENRGSFEARVRDQFEVELKRQLDSAERFAKAFGFAKLNRSELWRDMQRVVLRVVLELSPADILQIEGHPHAANGDPKKRRHAERAVQTAIANACDLVGLPRPRPGSPKKPRAHCIRVE
jgi:hypothetical protein